MTRCESCQARIVFGGVRYNGHRFCGRACVNAMFPPPPLVFCDNCLHETTEHGPGDLGTVNGWGLTLRGHRAIATCPDCRSSGGRVWFTVFFLPVIPLARYRVLYVHKGLVDSKFFARRYDPTARQRRVVNASPAGELTTAPRSAATGGLEPHRGGQLVVLGIMGLAVAPLGIYVFFQAWGDLTKMKRGVMDPRGRGLTTAALVWGGAFLVGACVLAAACLAMLGMAATGK